MRYTITFKLAIALAAAAGATPAMADMPAVMTDFPPVYGLVAMVAGDLGTPSMLLDQGANAHDFQLRPSQAAALSQAGLVVWIGPQMSPWLGRTLEGFDQVAQLRLLDVPGSHLLEYGAQSEGDHDHDHDGQPHEEDHHDDDHGHHRHEGHDPHAWLDPANGALWLDAIAAELGRLDPANAAAYAANALAGKARIAEADLRIAAQLAPVQHKPFVVFHDAYNYFAGHYGLKVLGAVSAGDASAPGAAHLRKLQQDSGTGALCLFPERGHDPKLLDQMAEVTGVRTGEALDPEGAAVGAVPDAYIRVLDDLAGQLADCLGQE